MRNLDTRGGLSGGREKGKALVRARADGAVVVNTLGLRHRLFDETAAGSIVTVRALRVRTLVRFPGVDDVPVLWARDVAYDQQVAKRQDLGGQQQKAGDVHAGPSNPTARPAPPRTS